VPRCGGIPVAKRRCRSAPDDAPGSGHRLRRHHRRRLDHRALSALCDEIGVEAGDFDILQGTSAGAEMVTMIGGDEADIVYVIAPMASTAGERAPGIGGAVENVLLRQPMSRTLRDEVAAVRARGTTVVAITPDSRDLAGLGANFMNRRHRRAAFEAAMLTAPAAVRAALAEQANR